MTPHILKTTALAAALALLAGCPAGDENNTNNSPRPDAATGDDTGADAGGDSGADAGEDAGEDAGRVEITCVKAWPSAATMPRTEGASGVALVTLCKGATIEELSKLSVSALLKTSPDDGGLTLDAWSIETEEFEGEWLRVTAAFDVPPRWAATKRVPFVSMTLGEVELEAEAPRTHLDEEGLRALHRNKALLTTTEASSLAAENPIFQAPAGASTNVLHGKAAGGGSSVFTANFDARTSMLKVYETPLGGGVGEVRGEFSFGRVDRASMVLANNEDGSSQLLVIAQCIDTRSASCDNALAFGRVTLSENGEVTQVEALGAVEEVKNLPPALFDGDEILAYTEVVVSNGGGTKLRMLYAARDLVENALTWAVVDAFDMSESRTPKLKLVASLKDMDGVTPQMVADGEASVGIIRAPDVTSLDPSEPVGEEQTLPWVAKRGDGGGTTYSMPFEDNFQAVDIADVDPGSAGMHAVYWGARETRALVLTGVDARRVPIDHVGAYNFTIEISGYRPLAMPGEPLPVNATRQDVIVGGADSAAKAAFFAVVLGMNNTKKDPAVPLAATLEESEMNAVFVAGGGELVGATSYPYASRTPVYLSEDPTVEGGTAVQLPNGIAVLAPLDALGCDVPGACDDVLARTETNFAILLGGGSEVCGEDDCDDGDEGADIFFKTGATAASKALFNTAPGYAFLISRRARAFDTPGGASAHAVTMPFEYEDGSGGLHLATIGADGEVVSSAPLSLMAEVEGEAVDLAKRGTEVMSFDGEDGVFVTPNDGAWTVGHMKATENGTTGAAEVTVEATYTITYADASSQLTVPSACPMHHPSCVLASARFAKSPSKSYQLDALDGDAGAASVLDAEFSAPAEPAPGAIVVAEWGTGLACGYATLLYPDLSDSSNEPIVVSTSDERDCSDLAIPVAVGDMLGQGGEQFVLLRKTATGGMLSAVFVAEDVDGDQAIHHMDLGEVGAALDVSRAGAAKSVNVQDVDGDGLPDVSFRGVIGGGGGSILFHDFSQAALFHTNGGGAMRAGGELSIPGLEVFGPSGGAGQVGGIQYSFGKGTKHSASETSAKPELL